MGAELAWRTAHLLTVLAAVGVFAMVAYAWRHPPGDE